MGAPAGASPFPASGFLNVSIQTMAICFGRIENAPKISGDTYEPRGFLLSLVTLLRTKPGVVTQHHQVWGPAPLSLLLFFMYERQGYQPTFKRAHHALGVAYTAPGRRPVSLAQPPSNGPSAQWLLGLSSGWTSRCFLGEASGSARGCVVFYLSLVAQTAQEEEGARGWLGWLTCWVVARQYSAVLRMLQMRQSSSRVNLAASEPSFSLSRLLMVSPPLLLVVLRKSNRN